MIFEDVSLQIFYTVTFLNSSQNIVPLARKKFAVSNSRRILHWHNTKFTNTLWYLQATLYFSFFPLEIKSSRVLTSQNLLISSTGVPIGYHEQESLALRQLQRSSHAPQKYRASLGWREAERESRVALRTVHSVSTRKLNSQPGPSQAARNSGPAVKPMCLLRGSSRNYLKLPAPWANERSRRAESHGERVRPERSHRAAGAPGCPGGEGSPGAPTS